MRVGQGRFGEYLKPSIGARAEQLLAVSSEGAFYATTDWSRDGRFILVDKAPADIWVIPMDSRA